MKKHISLIIALAIPVLMILFITASIYIPRMFFKPTVKFVYTTQYNNDIYQDHYQIVGHQILKIPARITENNSPKLLPAGQMATTSYPQLYLYDAATDTSSDITFAQAQSYLLDSDGTSPDGYTVTRGNGGGGIFEIFGGYNNNYNTWYLKNGTYSKKISVHIQGSDQYYSNSFVLLGWVVAN